MSLIFFVEHSIQKHEPNLGSTVTPTVLLKNIVDW